MGALHLIAGGGLIVYGLILKSKGEALFNESLNWWMVVGIGILFIIIGL
jgi:multisubunit Na+/H+ antiporter MnhB subunit